MPGHATSWDMACHGAWRATREQVVAPNFQSLSAFRIVFAACLLTDYLINLRPYFSDFYGNSGILPLSALVSDPGLPVAAAISRVLDACRLALVVPYLYPLALVAFGIGYRTRLATATVLLLNSYLYWRNVYILSGAEDLVRLLLIWCLFLPLNRYWSVDAALDPQSRQRPYPALPFAALRLQIISVYVFAGLFKLAGARWLDGSAVAMTLTDNMFGATAAGLYLASHVPGLLVFLNYATIALQLALPFLVYSPWYNNLTRGIALAAMAAMHASFIFCLNIGAFPYISMATLILLVPEHWWTRPRPERLVQATRIAMAHTDDFIGRQRRRLGPLAGWLLPIRAQPVIGPVAELACGALMWLALISNVMSLRGALFNLQLPFFGGTAKSVSRNDVFDVLQIGQSWRLFAPSPVNAQHHYRIRAEMTDGSGVDLMSRLPVPLVRSDPDGYSVSFANHRWLKFFSRFDDLTPEQWSAFGGYLCRNAHERIEVDTAQVRAIEIAIFVQSVSEAWTADMTPTNRHIQVCAADQPGTGQPADETVRQATPTQVRVSSHIREFLASAPRPLAAQP